MNCIGGKQSFGFDDVNAFVQDADLWMSHLDEFFSKLERESCDFKQHLS